MSVTHRMSCTLLGVALLGMAAACDNYDTWTTSPSATLSFSADTVAFDTVISTIPSSTRMLVVHNRGDKGLRIASVALEGGGDSHFRVNVDGQPLYGGLGHDFEVRRKDSLVVRLECTLPETGGSGPQQFADQLVFTLESGVTQTVRLEASAQDAWFVRGLRLDVDSVFLTDRPYVVYDSLVVGEEAVLTLPAGCTLMFHEKAGMEVYGRLEARGTLDAPVVMRGDRTDRMFAYLPYDNTPGRWEGLWFHTGSQGNVMQYVDLHSGNYGIRCDSTDLSPLVLLMENSVVHNLRGDGLHLEHSSAEVANTQVSNTLGNTVFLHGGSYSFVHCTFAQFYALSADRGPAVFLANDMEGRYLHLQQAWFHNCVATGYGDDVLYGSIIEGQDYVCDYLFDHCFLTTPEVKDDARYADNVWDHEDLPVRGGDNFLLFDTHAFLYDFTPDSLSSIRNMASPAVASRYPFDRLGRSRMADEAPDAGCYEYLPTNPKAQ